MNKNSEQKPSNWPRSIAVLAVIFGALWASNAYIEQAPPDSQPPPTRRTADVAPRTQAKSMPPTRNYQKLGEGTEPTAEQKAFFAEHVQPILSRAPFEYPVESVRVEFHKLMTRVHNKEIHIVVNTTPHVGLAAAVEEDGQSQLVLFILNVMDLHSRTSPETFEDRMIEVMCHEQWHLVMQRGNNVPGAHSPLEMAEAESDAWWYSVERLILPMIATGRLRGIKRNDPIALAVSAHKQARGDKNHIAWTNFSKFATGLPPSEFGLK